MPSMFYNGVGHTEHLLGKNIENITFIAENMDTLITLTNFLTKDGNVRDLDAYFSKYAIEPISQIKAEMSKFETIYGQLCYWVERYKYNIIGSDIIVDTLQSEAMCKAKHELFWIRTQASIASAMNVFFSVEMMNYVNNTFDILYKNKSTYIKDRPERIFSDEII